MKRTNVCLYCGEEFEGPKNDMQLYCSAACNKQAKRDEEYFDGMRRTAIGFEDRICWVCRKDKLKSFHVHHVIGRRNDPSDPLLVVLCPGCHNLITKLSNRIFLADPHKVADIITLARFDKGLPNVRTVVRFEDVD
jgi:5-methylcytosine-specific restriction endonuclease McrA